MKRLYGFNSKEIAEELKRQAEAGLRGVHASNHATGNEVRIVKLTEYVHPSGTTEEDSVEGPYVANEQFFGSDDLVLTEESMPAGTGGSTPVGIEVYNFRKTGYSSGDVVMIARWRSFWVIVDSGSRVKTLVTSSVITARSGATAGTGTAVSYTYDGTTGNYVTGTEVPPYDIINPYNASVSTSVVIQCHAVGDKWEIIQSECEGA